ncbi:MAG: hypothetical protein ACLFTG_11090 [Alphaproteobacteria bacterium]
MIEVSIIGLDLAKNVFQAHGPAADGSAAADEATTRLTTIPGVGPVPPAR